jgi:tetratricopeptide (TPR) repeat protein
VSRKKFHKHMRQFHTQKTELEIPKPRALKGWSIPEAQWLRAIELLADSPEKGLEVLRKLEVNYPPNVDVYYNTGVALLHLGRYDEAERYFEKALQTEPDNEYIRENLDSLLSLKKILSKRCSQDDLEEMGTVANTARDAGRLELAERIGNLMVDIDRGPGAFNDLGLTFQYQQEFEKAIQCYDKGLGIDPDMREALSNKAFCLMMTEKLDEAIHPLQENIRDDP